MHNDDSEQRHCVCNWLLEAMEDPRFPVEYDSETNQFKLICRLSENEVGYTVLHYCPLCGGKAPDIRQQQLFAQMSQQELNRLQALTNEIKSIEDALRILGEPEMDVPQTAQSALMEEEEEMEEFMRSLTYENLSETAVVHITDFANGHVRIVFQEKYIGKFKR